MKNILKTAIVLVFILALSTALVACDKGEDEIGKVTIEIRNADDLKNIVSQVGARYSEATFELREDIDLKDVEWIPIGSSVTDSFRSVFNGNGKTISNLTVGTPCPDIVSDNPEENYAKRDSVAVGLFGFTFNAVIKNLNVTFNYRYSTENEVNYAGGVIGQAYGNTVIENVNVSGSADILPCYKADNSANGLPTYENDKKLYVGGIAGAVVGTLNSTNVKADCDITVPQNKAVLEGENILNGEIVSFTHYTRFLDVFAGGAYGYVRPINIGDTAVYGSKISDLETETIMDINGEQLNVGGICGIAYDCDFNNVKSKNGSIVFNTLRRAAAGGLFGRMDRSIASAATVELCEIKASRADEGRSISESGLSITVGGAAGYCSNDSVLKKIDVDAVIFDKTCISYGGGLVGVLNESSISDSTAKGAFRVVSYDLSDESILTYYNRYQMRLAGAVGRIYGRTSGSLADGSSDVYGLDVSFEAYQGAINTVDAMLIVTDINGEKVNEYFYPVIDNQTITYNKTKSAAFIANQEYIDSGYDQSLRPPVALNNYGTAVDDDSYYTNRLESRIS